MRTAIFTRYVDDPSTSEQYLRDHSGERVTVHGELENPDRDEVGAIFNIEFADGTKHEAFWDELSDWQPEAEIPCEEPA
jgi:hypothetical protein